MIGVVYRTILKHALKDKAAKTKPLRRGLRGFEGKSLTMTYFHRRTSTIIGAKVFHGPVRDGKGWDHLAMVVKRSLLNAQGRVPATLLSRHATRAFQSGKKQTCCLGV